MAAVGIKSGFHAFILVSGLRAALGSDPVCHLRTLSRLVLDGSSGAISLPRPCYSDALLSIGTLSTGDMISYFHFTAEQ